MIGHNGSLNPVATRTSGRVAGLLVLALIVSLILGLLISSRDGAGLVRVIM